MDCLSGCDPVEDAFRALPLEKLPAGFKASVMRRVRELPRRGWRRAAFPFPWVDLTASFFLACMGGLALVLWQSTQWNHPFFHGIASQLRIDLLITQQYVKLSLPVPALGMAAGGVIVALVVLAAAGRMFARKERR